MSTFLFRGKFEPRGANVEDEVRPRQ